MDKCRICGGQQLHLLLPELRSCFGEVYSIKRCSKCSFVSVAPLPTTQNLDRYYNQHYWQKMGGKTAHLLELLYRLRMSRVIKQIKKLTPHKGRILDWGAGDGSLLNLLEKEGFYCWGIDTYSSNTDKRNLINATIEEIPLPNNFFDAITCFHVLEHIRNPLASLKKAFHLLKTGGIIVVEVPNIASGGFHIFKKKWYPLDIPVHLNHFSPTVIHRLFNMVGKTQIIKIDYFSHRHSPSSIVLSLFPSMSPSRVRSINSGHYPLPLMIMYLIFQVVAYPFALMESLINRGEIIRLYARKVD